MTQGRVREGSDYFAASGTFTFGPTETSKTVSVVANTDSITEPNESFNLNLSGPSGGATINDGQGVGTIVDVPPEPMCYDEGGQPIVCS